MDLGIMELTAVEDWPTLRPTQVDAAYYKVYFRSEYFGRVPESLLPQVREAMASAGGFECQPDQRTITALYNPRHYTPMCREIVGLVQDWMTVGLILSG